MSVKSSSIYNITFSLENLSDIFTKLSKSQIFFEALNPHDLDEKWQKVHFIHHPEKKQPDLETLSKTILLYQPKGLIAGFLDNRVILPSQEILLAEKSSDYILNLSQKLNRFNEIKDEIKSNPENEKLQSELTELVEYFKIRQVNPIKLDEETYAKIVALHTSFQQKQAVSKIAHYAFTLEEKDKTVFLFLAVKSDHVKLFEDFLNDNNILYQQTAWNQEIVEWENNNGLRSFQDISQALGTIGKKEIDPSFFVAICWMVFFAFAFGDALYAIIIAGFTGYLYFFKKLKPGIKNFMFLFFVSSIATILFGLVTNSWGGDLPSSSFVKVLFGLSPSASNTPLNEAAQAFQLLDLGLSSEVNKNLLINRLIGNNSPVVFMLGLSAALGFVAILFSYLIKTINSFKQSQTSDFFEDLNKFLFALVLPFVLIGMALNTVWFNLALSVLLVLVLGFFVFNSGKNILAKLTGGLIKIYELISFGSDIISFTRLAAIGLTGAIIGVVVNVMAGLLMGDSFNIFGFILAIIVLLIGHGFNLVLALFGGYINPFRLLYVELLPKFFDPKARNIKQTIPELSYAKVI